MTDRSDGAELSALAHGFSACAIEVQGLVRAAVAVFESPAGLAWVEPHYIDEWPGPPAYHGFVGTLGRAGDTLVLDGPQPCVVREADGIDRPGYPAVVRACRAWRAWCAGRGTDPDLERARLLGEFPAPLPLSG